MSDVVYLDCNATTPIEPKVAELVTRLMIEEYGNAGSRTHIYGTRAKQVVGRARDQVAEALDVGPENVTFTSGATESDNLAILGLREYAVRQGKKRVISTSIEHKAVLAPLDFLRGQGFEVVLLESDATGAVSPEELSKKLSEDVFLVSVMHVNNETGIVQPISEMADILADYDAFFHVDAAQGFGKQTEDLINERIDMISLSAHKIYGPKGVGALVTRDRSYEPPPLLPIVLGGGQERGLRAGTVPVPLVAGLGLAAEIAVDEEEGRMQKASQFKSELIDALSSLSPVLNGDQERCLPTTLNLSVEGTDSEAAIVALKDVIAISKGSACTSEVDSDSHVLKAMGLSKERIKGALRLSWCHMTPDVDWNVVLHKINGLR